MFILPTLGNAFDAAKIGKILMHATHFPIFFPKKRKNVLHALPLAITAWRPSPTDLCSTGRRQRSKHGA